MKFKQALEEKKTEPMTSTKAEKKFDKNGKLSSVQSNEKNRTITDPKKYPKVLWPYDTGISDRGISGSDSDINVLKGIDKLGH